MSDDDPPRAVAREDFDGELASGHDNDLAAAIREAIGADPDERIPFATPQFERADGVDVDWTPETERDIYRLAAASDEELTDLGLRRWADDLWLFPAEWYDHIPDGTVIETINGNVELFERGVTDDDRRFGVLPYGIRNGDDIPTTDRERDDTGPEADR